jgi:V8-like Glu-specific endopeptidase
MGALTRSRLNNAGGRLRPPGSASLTLSRVVHSSSRATTYVVALATAICVTAPGTAQADGIASRSVDQSAREVRAYWTPERIASARPASELLAGIPAPSDLLGTVLGAGEPTTRSQARRVPDPRARPFRTHGKVFFHLPSGDYVCSGTVVRARNKRLVTTAGHCVFGDGVFATNWMFVPAKDGGREPFGRWTAARLAAPGQWQGAEDVRYDVGMATIRKRNGRRLQKVVGARGIAFDRGRDLRFDVFGYPAEPPFDGGDLWRCRSQAQGTDQSVPSPKPIRIDCDMTGGASGGGWVIGRGRVNSVVSYGYECSPADLECLIGGNPEAGKLFGPYFGRTIKRLYKTQRR